MGARLSGRGSGSGWFLGQDAKLIAFRIGERDPAAAIGPPVVGLLRGSECEDSLSCSRVRSTGRRSRCTRFFTVLPSGTVMKSSNWLRSRDMMRHSSCPGSFGSSGSSVKSSTSDRRPTVHKHPGRRPTCAIYGWSWRQSQSPVWSRQTVLRGGGDRPDGPGAPTRSRFTTRSGHAHIPRSAGVAGKTAGADRLPPARRPHHRSPPVST